MVCDTSGLNWILHIIRYGKVAILFARYTHLNKLVSKKGWESWRLEFFLTCKNSFVLLCINIKTGRKSTKTMACHCSPLFYVFWRKNWLYLTYNVTPLLIILLGWTAVIFGYLYGSNQSVPHRMEVFETKEEVSTVICAILINKH